MGGWGASCAPCVPPGRLVAIRLKGGKGIDKEPRRGEYFDTLTAFKVMNSLAHQVKSDFQSSEATCNRVITVIQLLANKTRFRIVCLLTHGEFCVNDIVEVVGGRLSNVSQQLKTLTLAGIIERRRDQKNVLYSLRDERVRQMINLFREQFPVEAPGSCQ